MAPRPHRVRSRLVWNWTQRSSRYHVDAFGQSVARVLLLALVLGGAFVTIRPQPNAGAFLESSCLPHGVVCSCDIRPCSWWLRSLGTRRIIHFSFGLSVPSLLLMRRGRPESECSKFARLYGRGKSSSFRFIRKASLWGVLSTVCETCVAKTRTSNVR